MPRQTIDLLTQLVEGFGMTNEHFLALHHFDAGTTIASHIAYCRSLIRGFQRDGTNELVRERLNVALDELQRGGSWDRAISSALEQFPK